MSNENNNMKRVNYCMPQELIDRMNKAKVKTGMKLSEFVRRAIEDKLKELGL